MNLSQIWCLASGRHADESGETEIRSAVRSSGWLLADRVLRLAVGLLTVAAMARALGPMGFGQLNYAIAFVALFSPLATLGLDGIVVRNLVQSPATAGTALASTTQLRMLGAGAAFLLCNALISVATADGEIQLLVAVLSLGMLVQLSDVLEYWFQSRTEARSIVAGKLPALLLAFGARLALIYIDAPLIAYAWAQILELTLNALGLLVTQRLTAKTPASWRPDGAYAKRLLAESWPLIFAGVSVMLYMKIDIFMLKQLTDNREVGIYSVAARISESIYFLPIVITLAFAPMLIKARDSSPVQYRERFSSLYRLMSRLSGLIAVVFTAFAPWITKTVFGPEYGDAAPVLQVHIWAAVAVFLGVASGQYLTNEGVQRITLYRTLLGLAANILLNIALIPAYGALGAALATLISYFLSVFSMALFRDAREHSSLMARALLPFPGRQKPFRL